jgi:citrate lyase gamma subunit
MAKKAASSTEATVDFWAEKVQRDLKPKLDSQKLQQFKDRIKKLVEDGLNGFSQYCELEWTEQDTGAINCILRDLGVANSSHRPEIMTETDINLVQVTENGKRKPIWQQ